MGLYIRLSKAFWANTINTIVYLINCGPSVPLNKRLSEEVWSSKKVDLSHLKVFEYSSFVHIDE